MGENLKERKDPAGPRTRHWPAAVSFGAALLAAALLFKNRSALFRDLFFILFLSGILFFLLTRHPWGGKQKKSIWRCSVLLAFGLLVTFLPARQIIATHAIQFLTVWIPLRALAGLPWMVRHGRRVMIALVSAGLSLLIIHLAGPAILQRVLPGMGVNQVHRISRLPGVANVDGVQPDIPSSSYREEDFNIIVLGDSFAFGAGLQDMSRSFPFVLQEILMKRYPERNIRVANFGSPGSCPVLELRQFESIGATYKPDLVIQEIGMSAFSDDIRNAKRLLHDPSPNPPSVTIWKVMRLRFSMLLGIPDLPAFLKENLSFALPLAPDPPKEPKPLEPKNGDDYEDIFLAAEGLDYYFPLKQPIAQSAPWMRITWDAVLKTRALAKTMGAQYSLFIFPRCQHYDKRGCPVDHVNFHGGQIPKKDDYLFEPFNYFEEKGRGVDFAIHSLLPDFKTCGISPTTFPDDPHFNEAGHRVAAEAVARYLIQDGLVSDG